MSETIFIYSSSDLGLSTWTDILFGSTSTTVSGEPDVMVMSDDDADFSLEPGGTTQLLNMDLLVDGALAGTTGESVGNIGYSTFTNLTTGDIGTLYAVQIDGQVVGFASTVEMNPTDSLDISMLVIGTAFVPYDDLVACFVKGTEILTSNGDIPVEQLKIGDLVHTLDHGWQPIRWVGAQKTCGLGDLAPIRFMPGALGNARELLVSPQHRMFLNDWRAELLFGATQILVAAKDLVNGDTIIRVKQPETVYFHLLFDRHEIVFSHGCPSESFLPNSDAIGALSEATRQEILQLFPELNTRARPAIPPVRYSIGPAESILLQAQTGLFASLTCKSH